MNMIIGKRQIILAALVVGLGIAVYLNWQYAGEGIELPVTDALERNSANYGEAQYVDGQGLLEDDIDETPDPVSVDPDAYFAEAKMSRQRARDEAVETLAVILQDIDLDTSQRAELAMRAVELADAIEVEGKIENMLKAKGFNDVMVYYDAKRADVVLKTEGLMSDEVVQIRDIILRETSIDVENITITEIN